MKYWTAFLVGALSLVGMSAHAQETGPGPGVAEITLMPGGAMYFSQSSKETSFDSYHLGGAVTYNINEYVGVEGEVTGSLGITQNLAFGGTIGRQRPPDTFGYSGNLILSAPVGAGAFPYVTGGVGGMTMFQNTVLEIHNNANFLTGNVGGGIRWYVSNRIGFRGDYRFMMIRSSSTAPAFFGQEDRQGHRFYGGLILNLAP